MSEYDKLFEKRAKELKADASKPSKRKKLGGILRRGKKKSR